MAKSCLWTTGRSLTGKGRRRRESHKEGSTSVLALTCSTITIGLVARVAMSFRMRRDDATLRQPDGTPQPRASKRTSRKPDKSSQGVKPTTRPSKIAGSGV